MSLSVQGIEWRVDPPAIPDKLPVAILATPSYEERLHAVRTLHDRFRLGDTLEVDLPDGVAHASRHGEVQYFAASGAVRARNADAGRMFPDERRQWQEVTERDGEFVLGDETSATLFQDAGELLRAARLVPDGVGDVDVVLDRWARLSESGEELERGPGRAVVRAPYTLDGFPFIGAGAKTRLVYEPVDGHPVLVRIFHVHRPVTDVHLVHTGGSERALTGLLRDPFLAEHQDRGDRITVTGITIGLLTLPAVVRQRIAAPGLEITGLAADVPFVRTYQAVSAKALRSAGFAATHMPH